MFHIDLCCPRPLQGDGELIIITKFDERIKFMDALFKIPAAEFDENLFKRIQSLLTGNPDEEVSISVHISNSKGILRKETKEEYFERLLAAKNNLDKGVNAVFFTPSELKKFEKELLGEL